MSRVVDPRWPSTLRTFRRQAGLSLRDLATRAHYAKSYLHDLETGRKSPTPEVAGQLDDVLATGGVLTSMLTDDGENDAAELARRVTASDVSTTTITGLEVAVDQLAVAYPVTTPHVLLPLVCRHLTYVTTLVGSGSRMTLDQHRRILVAGGWMSLLTATVLIDLRRRVAAAAHLRTADEMAAQAEHGEIRAWCLETRAWDALVTGDPTAALQLAQGAQTIAPAGSSILLQATAQTGRALALLGDRRATSRRLAQLERMVSPLGQPDQPEHHYRYDPQKARAYIATTLTWAGDPAATVEASDVLAGLLAEGSRPRRIASARLDLGQALLPVDPYEATTQVAAAIKSGRVADSNWWRVDRVRQGLAQAGISTAELDELCEAHQPSS
ncbi:helix-turn-helix transcriptional regulator [Solwaraspora sp. WMMD406]|uniref:helix-turn-helix domain-containing protein n=1 Tax=Solwaraspora sp. WMMD406 TaxID=3016095 RepID=UPI0024162EB6|nr:helix-turn-helix transcriptional regulator [Solwaraspora sp. WMMD406]MDG4766778.1 helix-turn-helix transcriptional regulator [Solwaraspora sp. WMMD406]